MRIDWLIDWDGDVNPSIQEEVDFWAAWKGLNKMRQEHYQEGFGEYFWGQPRSDWTPWQHRAAAEDLMYPWSDWEERYPYTLCERVWYADWLYQQNLSHTGGEVWRGPAMAITRHDFYNIDTGFELMAAIRRAGAAYPIAISQTDRLQQWLDNEAGNGIAQSAGRRSLADRYRDLSQQIEAAKTEVDPKG
jgi:hypothetical protein